MRAVILAAGDGGRLGAHTANMPKPLVTLGGRPLILYTLEALYAAGVREAVVVTGHREQQLRAGLGRLGGRYPALTFVSNPHYHGGASLSLRVARPLVGKEPFLLLMADHVLSAGLLKALVAAGKEGLPGQSFVAADAAARGAPYADEATKLRFAPKTDGAYRRILQIGKHLPEWDALDTGAFLLAPEAWQDIVAAPEDCELSVIFGELAARPGEEGLFAADVTGAFWYDIDTTDDLAAAELLLAKTGGD